MPDKSNKNVKKMAELLRSGNTMLNKSCPVCNTPIFRNQKGELFCPSCNRKVFIVDKDSQQLSREESASNRTSSTINKKKPNKNQLKNINDELVEKTSNILKNKINSLLNKMETEIQVNQLREYIHLIKDLYELLFFLKKKNKNINFD
ncbi:MAG: hypothetical protein EU547_05275 [Promethearchaeota archaeon]|nr:MAG: hypothetical protein EU547_05275 [Candidatus Lokiarchaeota archaeon]